MRNQPYGHLGEGCSDSTIKEHRNMVFSRMARRPVWQRASKRTEGGKDKRKASGGIDYEGLLGQNVRVLTVLSKMKPVEVAEQTSYIN